MPLSKKVVVEWDTADEVVNNNFNSYQANNPVLWGTVGYPRVLNNNFNSHQANNPVLGVPGAYPSCTLAREEINAKSSA